jgi:rfaE bifunctional protein kinase chain/domain
LNTAQLSHERLAEIVARFSSCRIAVLGDFFLDKYLEIGTQLEETSLETGLPAHQVIEIRCHPGAAGTVTANLASLGTGELHAIGFVGDDGEGHDLRNALERLGCSTTHLQTLRDRYTPTYLKPRNAGDPSLKAEHSRYDTKNRQETANEVEARILASVDAMLPDVDAVVIMDQVEDANCGVVTERVREALAERAAARPGTIFWADSRRHIHDFRRVIVKPNQFESVRIDNPNQDDEVALEALRQAAGRIRERNSAPVVVTRGPRGMLVSEPEWTLVPGVEVTGEIDPTGAGDSVTAGVVLSLCAGANLSEAGVIGNLVASITVQQTGQTGVAKPDELAAVLERWQMQQT